VKMSATILLVEDEALVRRFLSLALRSLGYVVLEAGSRAEGEQLALNRTGRLDLLISDVCLGADSGAGLGRALRSRFPMLATLYISGGMPEQLSDGAFLQKPFSRHCFLARVQDLIAAAALL
jgi:two-component system, cell cycle sensor histidine kinase and response regulator CckA